MNVKPAGSNRNAFLTLTFIFIGSRFLFWIAGVQFYGSFAHRMWQLLDLQLLQSRFVESIWYYHAQPPMFNVLTSVVVKIFPAHFYFVFHLLMLLFSWSVSLLMFATLRELKVSRSIAFSASVFFLLNPALLLYENLYSYTLVTIFLVTLITYFLVKFVKGQQFFDWSMFVLSCGILCLTRSTFHFVWLLLLVPLLWRNFPRATRFRLVYGAALLVVLGWYVKNLVLFNTFSSSSWFGMNIARLVPPNSGLGSVGTFRPVSDYPDSLTSSNPFPEIAALSRTVKGKRYINFNHYSYIAVSGQFRAEVISEIQKNPVVYA
jgi:hypothetical protein